MDSVPLVAITGQVGSTRVGTDAFQEADIVGLTLPMVKHSYLIKDADDLPLAMAEALHIAQTGRPGPVLVDVCVDQWARDVEDLEGPVPQMPGYRPPTGAGHPRQIEAAARALAGAARPVIYAGGGIITGEASAELTRLSELTGIPVNTTLMGLGGFPGTHPLFIGMPGMHGIAAATYAFQASDVILAVGVRFDERVLSTVMSEWAPGAKIIHIDVDPAEISKNRAAHIGIAGQAAPGPGRPGRGLPGAARGPRRGPARRPGSTRSPPGSASTRTRSTRTRASSSPSTWSSRSTASPAATRSS